MRLSITQLALKDLQSRRQYDTGHAGIVTIVYITSAIYNALGIRKEGKADVGFQLSRCRTCDNSMERKFLNHAMKESASDPCLTAEEQGSQHFTKLLWIGQEKRVQIATQPPSQHHVGEDMPFLWPEGRYL